VKIHREILLNHEGIMRDKIILGFKTSIAPLPTLDFKQAKTVLKAATTEAI
jgi:hypothetical protein